MAYTVTVYFDNMVDATYYFEEENQAATCRNDLERKYRGRRLYRMKMEEV